MCIRDRYGIGCFSKEAYEFVDWLKEAGQSYWQILPLGPTSYGDSPYQSFSTFAGNPYYISLEEDVYKRQMWPSARPFFAMTLTAWRISSSFWPVITVLIYCFWLQCWLIPRITSR